MASAKQKAVWNRMKRAARICKGRKKNDFRKCMKRELKKRRK